MKMVRSSALLLSLGLSLFAQPYGVHAIAVEFNDLILDPFQLHMEIHPLKGGGGEIDVNRLEFTTLGEFGDMEKRKFVDTLVVQVSDACLADPTEESCDWPSHQVGIADSNGETQFCCTQDMVDNGEYCQVGRAIVSPNFLGTQARAELDIGSFPTHLSYSYMSYSYIDESQARNYAMLILNCNDANSVKVNGVMYWNSFPKESPFVGDAAGLTILSDLEKISRDCEIDVDFFNEPPQEAMMDEQYYIRKVFSYFHNMAGTCEDEQVHQLNQAFDGFETCSGFDLQEFIEDFPSAMVGTVIECVVATDWDQIDDWTDIEQLTSIELADACLDFEFGDNVVGFGLRQMALHPEKIMSCLQDFAPQVPTCTLETWPIPIVGSFLKTATCVVGDAQELLADVLKVEMGVWNTCLPDADDTTFACDQQDCIFEGSLLMRGGNMALPVSDLMKRLASTDDSLDTALKRYQRYLDECTDEWDGWTTYVAPSISSRHDPTVDQAAVIVEKEDGDNGFSKVGLGILMFLLGGMVSVCAVKALDRRANKTKLIGSDDHQLEMTESSSPATHPEGFRDPGSYTDESSSEQTQVV